MMRFRFWLVAGSAGIVLGCSQAPPAPSTPTPTGPVVSNSKSNAVEPTAVPPTKIEPHITAPATEPNKTPSAKTEPGKTIAPAKTPPSAKPEGPTLGQITVPGKDGKPQPLPFVKKVNITPVDFASTQSYDSTDPHSWRPSKVAPATVASQVDSMLVSLKGVYAEIDYALKLKTGNAQGHLKEKIQDRNTFSLQYPVVIDSKRYGLEPLTARAKSNGTVLTERLDNNLDTRKAGSTKPGLAGTELVQNFTDVGNREVFAGLLDGRSPFKAYVGGLLDKKNGYSTQVMERSMPWNGKTIRQYMIVAKRSGAAATKLGDSAVTLIIDADIHLPVQMSISVKKPGETIENYLAWQAKWANNQKFDPNEFTPLPPSDKSIVR